MVDKKQIKESIKEKLNDIISDIPSLFEENELAFISLQQKNERQIRDKVAFTLQEALDKTYPEEHLLVRCEWPSYYDEQNLNYKAQKKIGAQISGRSAVDMAILKMNDACKDYDEVLALVEFKAHCFLNHEKWPYEEFTMDVAKMYKMTSLSRSIKGAHLYFIMLTSSIESPKPDNYASAVAYKDILDKEGNKRESQQKPTLYDRERPDEFHRQLTDFWEGFNKLSFDFNDPNLKVNTPYIINYVNPVQKAEVPKPVVNSSGTAFGYKLWQTGYIWGPFTADELNVTEKSSNV